MSSKQGHNKKQHGAGPKDRRVGDSIEQPSGNASTEKDDPATYAGGVRRVPETPVDPIRALGGSMRMGVDEISGNPNAVSETAIPGYI
jgi:hypothetical protein